MMLLFSFVEEKTSIGDDGFLEKKGKGWSSHIVELDSVGVVEYLVTQASLMMLMFPPAEEKTSVGDHAFREKKGTRWSGRIVELDLVAVAA